MSLLVMLLLHSGAPGRAHVTNAGHSADCTECIYVDHLGLCSMCVNTANVPRPLERLQSRFNALASIKDPALSASPQLAEGLLFAASHVPKLHNSVQHFSTGGPANQPDMWAEALLANAYCNQLQLVGSFSMCLYYKGESALNSPCSKDLILDYLRTAQGSWLALM